MNQRDAEDRPVRDQLQGVEAVVERVAALDPDEGRVLARTARRSELFGGANVSDAWRIVEQRPQRAEVVFERPAPATG